MNLFKACKNDSVFCRDLRHISDDKTVIENPHKGWYLHYIDNGMPREIYRDDIAEGDYLEYIPGLNIIYLRIDWADIEKDDGVYDWSEIDKIMEKWGAHGYKFTFRFCSFEGMAHDIPYATPKFVFDKGAKYIKHDFFASGQTAPFEVKEPISYEPVYSDPIFLKYLDRFTAECARKLDGNPLVEYVDIGSFGTWGEGHTSSGSLLNYDFNTIKSHIDIYLKHFDKTRVILNYGMTTHILNQDKKLGEWLMHYCAEMGLGLRCDSVDVSYYARTYGYNTLSYPDMYDYYSPFAPVDLEHEHFRFTSADTFRNGLAYLEALKRAGATYAGFHGYITKWWPENKHFHCYVANRLGYWYFLDSFSLPPAMAGKKAYLTLNVRNEGFARAYNKYTAKAFVEDSLGNRFQLECGDIDNTAWLPGNEYAARLSLDFKNVKKGMYTLYFGLFSDQTPVKFAIKPEYYENGYCKFGNIVVE